MSRERNVAHMLSVVIPAYNEEQAIRQTVAHIANILHNEEIDWEILVVDDGSQDQTFNCLSGIAKAEPRIKALSLSRNFGKEGALLAGLAYASGNAVVTIDADLQHPPQLIAEMLARWRQGAQIVHAVKRSRDVDTSGKKNSAFIVNHIVSVLGGINLNNSSDFKLLDREIVNIILYQLPERQRFFRGLTGWLGFEEAYVYFDVDLRQAGESKWSLLELSDLAITALTSFSSLPLRIITVLGFLTLLLGFFVASDAVWSYWHGQSVSGFATIIISLLLIGSFIMISLGIIGEYIAKIYQEVKSRPHFLVKKTLGVDKKSN